MVEIIYISKQTEKLLEENGFTVYRLENLVSIEEIKQLTDENPYKLAKRIIGIFNTETKELLTARSMLDKIFTILLNEFRKKHDTLEINNLPLFLLLNYVEWFSREYDVKLLLNNNIILTVFDLIPWYFEYKLENEMFKLKDAFIIKDFLVDYKTGTELIKAESDLVNKYTKPVSSIVLKLLLNK